ncbi:MAG: hypothetical protein NC079_03205 [Clostridium sp.]|nr:hypothetical protein [Acetatifactor muris]MCM1525860.1 hypothetical protein [Bacteroides sp.]MCM1562600.1 hypothetical protein [Clostridium sp.]
MKKMLIKPAVFVLVFLAALVVAGKVMNKGHDNMTMEMADASLPVLMMERDGIRYNELHGYTVLMDIAFERNTVTVLGEGRSLSVRADTYGRSVSGLSMEVRSIDGDRLVERTDITNYTLENNVLSADFTLKDLIDRDTEYALMLTLTLDEDCPVYYYTRVIWSDNLHVDEKLAFVKDFHEKLYDREAATELTKYLESNAHLEDNTSFHKVNIHSSFRQITWGNLNIKEAAPPVIQLTEIGEQTASFLINYFVYGGGQSTVYYRVQEHYRIRYTAERTYLLDYERTMTQIPDAHNMCANDKILLGITGTDVPMMESEDGSNVVFEADNQLYSYNADSNKLTVIFSFYDDEHADSRTLYDAHSIKMLDVTEGGNVSFAVYGYMNRGRHEGEVGIQIYTYDSALNTIEENVYIPYNKNYAVLKYQMEQLLYLNRDQKLYLMLEDTVYGIDLEEKTYYPMVEVTRDDSIRVSDNHRIMVWQDDADGYYGNRLNVRNLNTEAQRVITAGNGEIIRPLGFMEEDIIYGVAAQEDVYMENSGRIVYPMYKVCICNSDGEILKTYSQEGLYVTDCGVEDNQITLERVRRNDDGNYVEAAGDHIMNSVEDTAGKYLVVAPVIDVYEQYVQIQTRNNIDDKTIQILNPKEVVFEGGRNLEPDMAGGSFKYYIYGAYGVDGIYYAPAKAVNLANSISGVVVDHRGNMVWMRGNRALRNQIRDIAAAKVSEEKNSLAVCLDTMLKYEGIIRNSDYLLSQGQTVMEILEENLENAQILDLTGCDPDAVLYYVNRNIPVLALMNNGDAVLITGFDEFNIIVMDPVTGTLSKQGKNDSAEKFRENGNNFVTYIRE